MKYKGLKIKAKVVDMYGVPAIKITATKKNGSSNAWYTHAPWLRHEIDAITEK